MTDASNRAREVLKPCPFCGGEAKRFTIEEEGENFGGDVIQCMGVCGASSHVEFGRKENLVSLWNTRAPADERAAQAHAAGRSEGLEEAAKVADRLAMNQEGTTRADAAIVIAQRIRRLADRQPERGGEDMVLVPRVPTEAMYEAAWNADTPLGWKASYKATWDAMLAAIAPASSEGEGHRG